MITVRKSNERGHANHGWLDSHHTFSFAGYYDPNFTGFRDLLVINEDRVAPGAGFGTHPHRDMEIISYVVAGALEHKDSMGTGSVVRPGDVQRMSAGTGVTHSEYNHSGDEALRFLQIWITPRNKGTAPGYAQAHFSDQQRSGKLCLVASPEGEGDAISIDQDVRLYSSLMHAGPSTTLELAADRYAWVQVIDGTVAVNDVELSAGDAVAVAEESSLTFRTSDEAHFLVFDLA